MPTLPDRKHGIFVSWPQYVFWHEDINEAAVYRLRENYFSQDTTPKAPPHGRRREGMRTHTSYEVSKRLKEFMGEGAPEAMDHVRWIVPLNGSKPYTFPARDNVIMAHDVQRVPAYQLHDLLSRPFCEAFLDALEKKTGYCPVDGNDDLAIDIIARKYFFYGLPAVERALIEMMDGEGK